MIIRFVMKDLLLLPCPFQLHGYLCRPVVRIRGKAAAAGIRSAWGMGEQI